MTDTASTFRTAAGERAVRRAYDEMVAHLLPDAARIHVETSTGAAHGLDVGSESAPPVVLLHGSGATSIGWAAELADLSRDHRVIALDLPGEAAAPPGTRLPLEPGVHAS